MSVAAARTHRGTVLAYLRESRRARWAAVTLLTFVLIGVFADVVVGGAPVATWGDRAPLGPVFELDPVAPSGEPLSAPAWAHPLGTDERGRDVFARLVHGTRTALGTSVLAVAASVILGLIMGALAGTGSARWNRRLERFAEAVDTFPAVIVVAVLRAIETSPSIWSVALGVALVKWAEVARIVRAEVLRLSIEDFVLAARALGATRVRLLTHHLLPHTMGPVAVSAALGVASVTLLETAVGYLGLGPEMETPSWGDLLAQAARHPERPALLLAPTLAVGLTVGAAFLLADALRDATDPRAVRLRNRRGPLANGQRVD